MAKVEDYVIILDDIRDIDKIEIGMHVTWVDREEGAFGFSDYDSTHIKWQKFLWQCKKLFRRKK